MRKKYQIFISSTLNDLRDERKIVKDAILEMKHFPVGMEEFPAVDMPQMDYIKELLDDSDYYVLILGGKLGTVNEQTGKSYTYMEYLYAKEKGIPILAVIRNGECLEEETGRIEKYESFLSEVTNDRVCSFFDIKEQLSGIIHKGLSENIKRFPQPGWVKRDKIRVYSDSELLLRGKLLDEFHIDKRIYDVQDQFYEFQNITKKCTLKYGIDTQQAFKFVLFIDEGECAYNLYNDIDSYFFEDDGILRDDVGVQLSFARMGNQEEELLFFSIGNHSIEMRTKIYRVSNIGLKEIGNIEGQEYMSIDYDLYVPIGSQGDYFSYVYVKNDIHRIM